MSQIEEAGSVAGVSSSDFTLLEGLYQLSVNGNTQDWEFERLNNAVYERLLSSYGSDDVPFDQSKSALAGA
ncbi:hypothetical protein EA658_05975 [Pseudoxanthomonas winnipegensis]|jgi:hypothetical protein|uniref:Uncharacterized protein n=1 Tax=Pseudoxanthomonas winnipegensis TaxID=2480810 RepID=A0ABY1WEY1_9GAMM|nr:hypothetical protein [Pseudoxanthomonas winnipegensis]TAA08805.1 hypothetical protein EA659_13210 [Pseudoxanthomonas winnipegensis]TAA20505.1 hypothetical protein EA658_05975 [Pseudoxanthomonas winnipegensis]TAH71841.1 hypothetical protein EA657_12015 [Pseudoxanthomonas winnipegensis]